MARTIPADNLYMLSTADRLPLIAAVFIRAASVVTEWDRRSRTRQQLKHLDKHLIQISTLLLCGTMYLSIVMG